MMPGKIVYDRKRMRELYDQGLNDHAIAREIGCDKTVPWQWRKKENIPSLNPPTPSPAVPAIEHYHFPYKAYLDMIKQAVIDSGVAIHTPEGRSWLLWASERFLGVFTQAWVRE